MAQQPTNSIDGKWHLLQASDDEINVPQHRMDLVFRDQGASLTGAVINRVTGGDIPLASLRFDGTTLTLQLADSSGKAAPAVLTMTASGGKFEGQYVNGQSEPIGPRLKLVRFRE
jgi:hypothetical protein